jgi:serine/threonine protein kinase
MSDNALLQPMKGDPRIGVILQDRYRVVRKIGEGGMGAVYEGEHMLISRRVAIKCLHAQFATNAEIVARFQNEAMAANSIRHQNIIEVTDMGRFEDGTVFMVLEFLDGRELAQLVTKEGPQPLGRLVHIATQVCDALTAAHSKGIVHRDLKPENIYLVQRGDDPDFVKVLDFGIAKFRETANKSMTRTGTTLGTPYYMAPEQAQAKRELDGRADIYSLGVILFHALTGQHPFDDESYPMLVVKICTEPPPPLRNYRPDLPPEFEAVVGRMLAKNPEERYPNTQAVKEALQPFRSFFGAPVLAEGVLPTAKIAPTQALSGVRHSSPTSAGNPMSSTPPATNVVNVPVMKSGTPAPGFGTPVPSAGNDYAATTGYPVQKSRAPLFIGIVAALFVLGGVAVAVGWVLFGKGTTGPEITTNDTDPEPTPPDLEPTAMTTAMESETPVEPPTMDTVEDPGIEQVRLIINLEPSDAELFIDGASMGSSFNARVPSGTALQLEARREGYETLTQSFTPRFDGQVLTLTLERGRGAPRDTTNVPSMMSVTTMDDSTPMQTVTPPVETPMEAPMVMEGFMVIML